MHCDTPSTCLVFFLNLAIRVIIIISLSQHAYTGCSPVVGVESALDTPKQIKGPAIDQKHITAVATSTLSLYNPFTCNTVFTVTHTHIHIHNHSHTHTHSYTRSLGNTHTVLMSNTGEVFTFGCGKDGQLGHDTLNNQYTPRYN